MYFTPFFKLPLDSLDDLILFFLFFLFYLFTGPRLLNPPPPSDFLLSSISLACNSGLLSHCRLTPNRPLSGSLSTLLDISRPIPRFDPLSRTLPASTPDALASQGDLSKYTVLRTSHHLRDTLEETRSSPTMSTAVASAAAPLSSPHPTRNPSPRNLPSLAPNNYNFSPPRMSKSPKNGSTGSTVHGSPTEKRGASP